jgi:hypothetical protein
MRLALCTEYLRSRLGQNWFKDLIRLKTLKNKLKKNTVSKMGQPLFARLASPPKFWFDNNVATQARVLLQCSVTGALHRFSSCVCFTIEKKWKKTGSAGLAVAISGVSQS